MNFIKKYVLLSPVHYGIALGFNAFFFLLVLFIKGFDKTIYYVDAFGVAGGISLFFGLLLLVSSLGAFTTFGYAFSYFRGDRKYKDLYEYTTAKKEKEAKKDKMYMSYIWLGVIFLMISFILTKGLPTV